MQTTHHLRQRLSLFFFFRLPFFSLFVCFRLCFFVWVPLHRHMCLYHHCHKEPPIIFCSFVVCSNLCFKNFYFLVPLHNLHHHRLYTHCSCSCLSVSFSACLLFVVAYALFMGAIVLYRHLCLYHHC